MKNMSVIVLTGALILSAHGARGAGTVLTDDQARRYQAVTTSRDELLKPLLDRQQDGLRKVRTRIAASESERDVKRELDELKAIFVEIQSVETRYNAELASFLTPGQRVKLAASRVAKASEPAHVPGEEEEKE